MLEHDEDDRYITQQVFDENQFNVKLQFANTSDELYAYLMVCEKNDAPFPSLVLLNYHTYPSTAKEIVQRLKTNPKYQHIPVVVLSGTVREDIIKECYGAGANSFIQKPSRSADTVQKIGNFFNYWFKTVELP